MIQGLKLLAFVGIADNEISLDNVGVKGMHWGAQKQHHVVSNVRGQVYAALAAEHELAL